MKDNNKDLIQDDELVFNDDDNEETNQNNEGLDLIDDSDFDLDSDKPIEDTDIDQDDSISQDEDLNQDFDDDDLLNRDINEGLEDNEDDSEPIEDEEDLESENNEENSENEDEINLNDSDEQEDEETQNIISQDEEDDDFQNDNSFNEDENDAERNESEDETEESYKEKSAHAKEEFDKNVSILEKFSNIYSNQDTNKENYTKAINEYNAEFLNLIKNSIEGNINRIRAEISSINKIIKSNKEEHKNLVKIEKLIKDKYINQDASIAEFKEIYSNLDFINKIKNNLEIESKQKANEIEKLKYFISLYEIQ